MITTPAAKCVAVSAAVNTSSQFTPVTLDNYLV